MSTYHKSTPAYRDWIFWLLMVAAAALFYCALTFNGHSETLTNVSADSPAVTPAVKPSPQAIAATISIWWTLLLLPIGGTIWHMILKVAPWAKANGGLLRGVIRFFWDSAPVILPPKPSAPLNTAPPELAPTPMR
jgi:hypothetical protein